MQYFCYVCKDQTIVDRFMSQPVCQICHSEFVEEYTFYDVSVDFYTGATTSSESMSAFGHDIYQEDEEDNYYDEEDQEEEAIGWDIYEDATSQNEESYLPHDSDHTWETYEEEDSSDGSTADDNPSTTEEEEERMIVYSIDDEDESYGDTDDEEHEYSSGYGYEDQEEPYSLDDVEEDGDQFSDESRLNSEIRSVPGEEEEDDENGFFMSGTFSTRWVPDSEGDDDDRSTEDDYGYGDADNESYQTGGNTDGDFEENTPSYFSDEEEAFSANEEQEDGDLTDDDNGSGYNEAEDRDLFPYGRGSEEEFREAYDMSNILRVLQEEEDPAWNLPETWETENGNGASRDQIKYLPRRILRRMDRAAATECTICQERFGFELEILRLPCQHEYHGACIERWLMLNATCPIW